MLSNIEYLAKKPEFRVGDIKNLAVLSNQKDDMSKMYPKVESNTVSNADMLSQSFGSNQIPVEESAKPKVTEPIQVSAIPGVQNSFNMESNPVDLSINSVNVEPVIDEKTNLNIPSLDSVSSLNLDNSPIIEPINANNNVVENSFKVSDQQNIFDTPSNLPNISQEEINKPVEIVEENNIFNKPVDLSLNNNESFDNSNSPSVDLTSNLLGKEESINDDIILAQIAVEEKNVELYRELAKNSEKKIELLKRQVKKKKEEDNIENTASNLFNNSGVLDEEKVLGKTPMPNIMVA